MSLQMRSCRNKESPNARAFRYKAVELEIPWTPEALERLREEQIPNYKRRGEIQIPLERPEYGPSPQPTPTPHEKQPDRGIVYIN